jgi:5-methylthioadenosine/S-adenosylhomocysteine deaminase
MAGFDDMTADVRGRRRVIGGGLVLDETGEAARLDIVVAGDTIEAIVPPSASADIGDAERIDASGFAIIPGLVNAHTHGHGGLSKGSGDRWSLELFLNAGGWVGGNRSDEDRHLSTLLAACEMLLKGCTACFDLSLAVPLPTYGAMAAAAQAYLDAGMRAVVAPMIGDIHFYRALPGLIEAAPDGLRQDMERAAVTAGASILPALATIAKEWSFPANRIRLGIAPTIPLHSTDEFLLGCDAIARDRGLALQTHLDESRTQAAAAQGRYRRSVTAHLAALGLIDERFSGAHGVWLDEDDMRLIGDLGGSIAHNPGSNLRLGSGIADVRALLDNGVNVGIGTDGAASADGQNMFEATRLACNLSRVQGRAPQDWLGAEDAIRLATEGSARVLGMHDSIGRIAPGFRADLVFLNLGHINYTPLNRLINQVVHVEDGNAVTHVMVGSEMVVKDRQLVKVNMAALARQAAVVAERLRETNAATRAAAERLAPFIGRFCHSLACGCRTKARRQLENVP